MGQMGKKSNKMSRPATVEERATGLPGAPRELRNEVERRLAVLEPDVEVLSVEVVPGRRSGTIRIFLDSPEGVTHETCARVTSHLGDFLREYSLEVSSPGPSRPLSKPEHFRRFVGRRARLRTNEAIDGRTDLRGELIDADDDRVTLAGAWGTVVVPYENIRRSNLIASKEES
jgi:ribosome maturation factor RimP